MNDLFPIQIGSFKNILDLDRAHGPGPKTRPSKKMTSYLNKKYLYGPQITIGQFATYVCGRSANLKKVKSANCAFAELICGPPTFVTVLRPPSVTVAILKVQCGRLPGTCSSPRLHKPSHLFPKLKIAIRASESFFF